MRRRRERWKGKEGEKERKEEEEMEEEGSDPLTETVVCCPTRGDNKLFLEPVSWDASEALHEYIAKLSS